MAKVIQSERNVIVVPWWAKEKSVYIGLTAGLIWWVVTALLRRYVVEPLACRDLSSAAACVNSVDVAGNIAAIIVAVAGTALLIRYLQPRPIVIAVGTLALLWGLGGIMNGIAWYFVILWAVFFYAASYSLFSLITRIKLLWLALIVATLVVIVIRFLVTL